MRRYSSVSMCLYSRVSGYVCIVPVRLYSSCVVLVVDVHVFSLGLLVVENSKKKVQSP